MFNAYMYVGKTSVRQCKFWPVDIQFRYSIYKVLEICTPHENCAYSHALLDLYPCRICQLSWERFLSYYIKFLMTIFEGLLLNKIAVVNLQK